MFARKGRVKVVEEFKKKVGHLQKRNCRQAWKNTRESLWSIWPKKDGHPVPKWSPENRKEVLGVREPGGVAFGDNLPACARPYRRGK